MKKKQCLALVVFILSGFVSAPQGHAPIAAVEDRVSIRLKGIDGKTYDISEMRGRFLVVAFGATWCQPCHEELRDLEILHLEFKDRPVRFLWISLDDAGKGGTSNSDLKKFARELNFTFPILRDPEREAYKQFSKRQRIPLLVVFDKEGRVVLPNQFGAASQPGFFRITFRNRLKDLFAREETLIKQ